MLARSHADVLSVLSTSQSGLTTAEIFKNIIEFIKDSPIVEPEQISKITYAIRNAGYITTENKKKKIHAITEAGKIILESYIDDVLALELKDTPTPENVPAKIDVNEQETELLDTLNILDIDLDLLKTSTLKTAKELGLTVLDPQDELHAPFIEILKLLEAAASVRFPTIANKFEKINTLEKLGNLLSDDLKTMLDAIVPDLNQLQEIT
jgi:DNA-binding PadR family transcriptional regulator